MPYFSGFCLDNEMVLFKEYLTNSVYEVVGFSYGAIKAFEYSLTSTKRIDTLTLLSPAFFQTKSQKFKRLQLFYFKKDKQKYIKNFLQNTSYPCKKDLSFYQKEGSYEELKELLEYIWDTNKIKQLIKKDIKIIIHLGEKDKIIESDIVYDFFKPYATIYYHKDKGHILCKR